MTHQFDPLTKGSGVEGFFAASYLTAAEKFFSEKLKGSSLSTETLVFQNWCRGRDSNPHSYCHYPLKIACLPVPPPRRQKALYAKPRRLASLFSAFFPFRPRLFRLRAGASGGGTWSIFSLKSCTFQTIRPVVSWKKHGFSAHFGPGGAVPQLRVLP